MNKVSNCPTERAKKITTTIIRALAKPGMATVIAAETGMSESQLSRLKNDHLDPMSQMFAHLGYKVVPTNVKCYRPDQITALLTMAQAHMKTLTEPDALDWEDG